MADNMEKIERKLDEHGRKLDAINKTLEKIAVQDERIRHHDNEINKLQKKYDEKIQPCLTQITTFQASCPRNLIDQRLNRLWWASTGVGFVAISTGVALLALGAKIIGWA